ncbi:MAG TPA: FAD-dependent oxidoreductase [Erysipelotrichaceae bacterium]|nr:FAD-dependent oxidoreductase [Erysipelotrichaceae bacterium]
MIDVIIVGGGPAGMSAALNLLRAGRSVLILEKENFGGQIAHSPRVENVPGIKEISGLEFSGNIFEQILFLGARFELEEVTRILKVNDVFEVTTNYRSYNAKAVILANGVKHRKMNLPNEDEFIGKGISFCAVCDGAFYKGEDVYLIGDANTALQYALMLANTSANVHLFTLFDRFFADKILIDRLKQKSNIHVTHNMNLIAYLGKNELAGLRFENTINRTIHEFPTNNVFIAIGQVSQNDLFKALVQTDESGFVITNEKMETSLSGLFAIGDTRKKDVRQVASAFGDASVASVFVDKYLQTL